MVLAPARPEHVRIVPAEGWASLGFAEMWEYRELLYFLTWRDIKVRYKQTALGAAWAIIFSFVLAFVLWKAGEDALRWSPLFPVRL